MMAARAARINAPEAKEHVESQDALLVCAYEDPAKYEENCLEGSMSLQDFEAQVDSIRKDQEIIFYCQ